jgi:hypothetical protein
MKLILCCGILCVSLSGCSTNRSMSEEYEVLYLVRNELHGTETSIHLLHRSLKVRHMVTTKHNGIDEEYRLDSLDRQTLTSFLRKIQVHQIVLPPPDRVLDAPQEDIIVTSGGTTSTFALRGVREIPESIRTLRGMLIDLAKEKSKRARELL